MPHAGAMYRKVGWAQLTAVGQRPQGGENLFADLALAVHLIQLGA
jgi:hypothetical protein